MWAPNGRWLAFVRSYGEIWRVRAGGSGERRVSRPGSAAVEPTWSPSGKRLAYTRSWEVTVDGYPEGRSAAYVVRRDGTGTRRLHSGSGSTWSPDGRVIAFRDQGSLAVISPDGRGLRVISREVTPLQLQFAPVGRSLVFIDGPDSGASAVSILDMRSGTLRRVPEDPSGDQPQSVAWTPDGRRLAYLRNHWVTKGGISSSGQAASIARIVCRPERLDALARMLARRPHDRTPDQVVGVLEHEVMHAILFLAQHGLDCPTASAGRSAGLAALAERTATQAFALPFARRP